MCSSESDALGVCILSVSVSCRVRSTHAARLRQLLAPAATWILARGILCEHAMMEMCHAPGRDEIIATVDKLNNYRAVIYGPDGPKLSDV